jgi:hypothetical protein
LYEESRSSRNRNLPETIRELPESAQARNSWVSSQTRPGNSRIRPGTSQTRPGASQTRSGSSRTRPDTFQTRFGSSRNQPGSSRSRPGTSQTRSGSGCRPSKCPIDPPSLVILAERCGPSGRPPAGRRAACEAVLVGAWPPGENLSTAGGRTVVTVYQPVRRSAMFLRAPFLFVFVLACAMFESRYIGASDAFTGAKLFVAHESQAVYWSLKSILPFLCGIGEGGDKSVHSKVKQSETVTSARFG